MTKNLDIKDWKILNYLCTDARMSHNQIGKLVGLGKDSVTYRVQRLVKKGIITRFFTIIDQNALGITDYSLFARVNASEEQEADFIQYIKSNPNVSIFDRFLGDWDFLIEFGSRNVLDFYSFLSDLKEKFGEIIDGLELHLTLEAYKLEELSVGLDVEKPAVKPFKKLVQPVKVDKKDLELIQLLDQDSTQTFFELGEKLGITYETVSARIKRLKELGVILKFSAEINLNALGHDVYLIFLELRNLSKEKDASLRNYINSQKNIRYAFMSATKPILFVYLAVKSASELNTFLSKTKKIFSDSIVSQKYLLSTAQLKNELFPEGFMFIYPKLHNR